MKHEKKFPKRFLSFVILFAAVGVLLVTALPSAYAQAWPEGSSTQSTNSPGASPVPSTPVVGGTLDIVITAAGLSTDHIKGIVRVYEPGVDPDTGSGTSFISPCDFGTTIVTTAGRRVFQFNQFSSQGSANEYTMDTGGSDLVIPFTGGAVVPTLGAGVSLDENTGIWIKVEGLGSGTPSIDFLTAVAGDEYRIATCGYDNTGLPQARDQYNVDTGFPTQQAVGGEILPINTSALLLAGLGANTFWMLPVLAAIAGASFVVLRLQLTRKNQ